MVEKFVLIIGATFTFLRFSIALRRHFSSTRLPAGMAVLSLVALGSFVFISFLSYFSATRFSIAIGLVGISASWWLFGKSLSASTGGRLKVAFDKDLPETVLSDGVYSKMRHPMYSAYIIFWASFAIGSWDWRAFAPAFLLISTYVVLALSEQKRLLASPNADDYSELMARTGLFWPKIW